MEQINQYKMTLEGLEIPDGMTQGEWCEMHRKILTMKRGSGKWLSRSRSWAAKKWGAEDVGQHEFQLELELGIKPKKPKPQLNPQDKSEAIVTIEGVVARFNQWKRKMADTIPDWDRDQAKKALDLLEPIARQYEEIKRMIERELNG
jgi:hypothetical protein